MLKQQQALAIILILLFFSLNSKALYAFQTGRLDWQEINSEHFEFIFPPNRSKTEAYLQKHIPIYESMYRTFKQWFPRLPSHIPVLIDPRAASHNGSATTIPTPRIALYTTPPAFEQDLGQEVDYLTDTFLHELAHIAHLTSRSDAYDLAHTLFGHIVSPASVTPRWLIEGFAVWVETHGSKAGRGRSTFFQGLVEVLAPQWPSIADLTGFPQTFPAGRTPYFYGYLFFEYLYQQVGEERILAFVRHTGHILSPFYDSAFKGAFDKPLSVAWQEAGDFYKSRMSNTSQLETPKPLEAFPHSSLRRWHAEQYHQRLYFWELENTYEGYRLVSVHLDDPKRPYTVLTHLTPPQPLTPHLAVCQNRLYGILNQVSDWGAQPKLVWWALPKHTYHDAGLKLGDVGKVIDLTCSDNTLYLLTFRDMSYHLLRFSRDTQTFHHLHTFETNPDNSVMVHLIDRSRSLQILTLHKSTHGHQNEIWQWQESSHSIQRIPLKSLGRRRLHYIIATQEGYLGIVDAPLGRRIVTLNSRFKPEHEFNIQGALPIGVIPLTHSSTGNLLLRHFTRTGETFSTFLSNNVKKQAYQSSVKSIVPHSTKERWSAFEYSPPQRSESLLAVEEHSPSYLPTLWVPLLRIEPWKVNGIGFRTVNFDSPPTFSYDIETLFLLNPFGFLSTATFQWESTLHSVGPLLHVRIEDEGTGFEREAKTIATGFIGHFTFSRLFNFFTGLSYQPIWNKNKGLRHRLTLPIRLSLNQLWGSSLHPMGWAATGEVLFDLGSISVLNQARVLNAPNLPTIQNPWHLDFRGTLRLMLGIPLFSSTAGIFQVASYTARATTGGPQGPVIPELLFNRPMPVLASSNLLPSRSNLESFPGHHLIIHKFRPFLLLARLDRGIFFLPLMLHNIWLEGIWDTAFAPELNSFFGSFGGKLQLDTTTFFHLRTLISFTLVSRWILEPSMDDVVFAFVIEVPTNI